MFSEETTPVVGEPVGAGTSVEIPLTTRLVPKMTIDDEPRALGNSFVMFMDSIAGKIVAEAKGSRVVSTLPLRFDEVNTSGSGVLMVFVAPVTLVTLVITFVVLSRTTE